MGGKIPESIRRDVIRQWLEGLPRQQIAKDNHIGTGTVSEIIKALTLNNTQLGLICIKQNTDPPIRIASSLEKKNGNHFEPTLLRYFCNRCKYSSRRDAYCCYR